MPPVTELVSLFAVRIAVGRGGSLRTWTVAALLLLLTLIGSQRLAAQDPGIGGPASIGAGFTAPPDAYGDAGVRDLMDRARAARTETAEGLLSYEGRMWERVYFGVSGPSFRRERGVFEEERVSSIRWSADGEHVVRWEGARRDVPIAGVSTQRSDPFGASLVDDLAGEGSRRPTVPPPLAYDPASDQLSFGGEWALSPLADTSALHYRFRSGDTLTVQLPVDDRRVVLAEVLVEPRRSEFRLVSASLWFDVATGHLVRAGYRPARPFDLEVDGPEDGELPPGFLRPVRAEIRYVTVDHGLHDLRWWIPRRFTFEGEAQVSSFVRFPIQLEWTVEEVRVNEAATLIPTELPEGWRQGEAVLGEGDDERRVTVLVPTLQELRDSPILMGGSPVRGGAFSEGELREFRERLDRIGSASRAFSGARFAWGSQDRLTRYNRVEGLSLGVAVTVPLPARLDVRLEGRYGFADRKPGGALRLRHGSMDRSLELAAFRDVVSSTEWATPGSLSSSMASVLWGGDHAPFHRVEGVEGLFRRESRALTREVRFFVERQESVTRNTHAHLSRLWTDRDLRENPAADVGTWSGGALRLRGALGTDPRGARIFGALRVEGATGTTDYGRGWLSGGVAVPLRGSWSVALEGGVGGSAGELPAQRRFFPGGPAVFRALPAGDLAGEEFWFGRTEIGSGPPGIRAIGFLDLVAVGPKGSLGRIDPSVAVGGGISVLDGLFRLDVVRLLERGAGWRVLAYSDALF